MSSYSQVFRVNLLPQPFDLCHLLLGVHDLEDLSLNYSTFYGAIPGTSMNWFLDSN